MDDFKKQLALCAPLIGFLLAGYIYIALDYFGVIS